MARLKLRESDIVITEACALHIRYNNRGCGFIVSADSVVQTGPYHRFQDCPQTPENKNISPFNKWLGEMTKMAYYELIFKLNNRQEVFLKIWRLYMKTILDC